MRRVNKVVLIFFIFTIAVFYSVLEVLQSDFLGNNASKAINKALVSKYGVSVNFQKVKFQLFPPGIELRNVRVDDTKNNEFLFLTSKIGAYFDIRDIFLEKPTISEILIFDGHLKLNIKKSKEKENESTEETKLETVKVTEYIKLLEDKLPIDFKKINFNALNLKKIISLLFMFVIILFALSVNIANNKVGNFFQNLPIIKSTWVNFRLTGIYIL